MIKYINIIISTFIIGMLFADIPVSLSFSNVTSNSLDVVMNNPMPVAGFQMELPGINISSISGGTSGEQGISISFSGSILVGFTLSGDDIPPGNAVLFNVGFTAEGTEVCFQDVIVSDENGVGTDLDLGYCANIEDPESWEINPANYELYMTVTAVLEVNNQPSSSNSIALGAFVDDVCRGYTYPILVGEKWMYFLMVYANTNNEVIEFAAYDIEYDLSAPAYDFIVFENSVPFGSPDNPYIFNTTLDYNLDCSGVPFGSYVEDMCGTCDDDSSNDCIQDCTGEWGGTAEFDDCGVCGGSGITDGQCDCEGNVEDCAGECGGSTVVDECGICGGDGSSCTSTVDLSLDLIAGWNWISFNVNPEDASLSSLLGSIGDDATFISSQSFGTAQNYGVYGWYGGLTELDPTQMYKLEMTTAADLVITGMPVDVASTPISLIAGWNWLGYLPQNAGALGEALASVGDLATFISSQSAGTAQNYGVYGWYGGLATLEPGNGYLLDMSGPGELVYPEFSGAARLSENKQKVVLAEAISHWDFNYSDYQYIGTVTASIDSRLDFDGDVVAVFVDDQCRGLAERMYFPFDDRYFYIIQAYSNVPEGEKMTFKYYDSVRDEVIEYGETISFNNNMVVGDGFNTFGLSREVDDLFQPMAYGISEAYPNPFNPVTNFSFSLLEDTYVSIAVYNISGRLIETIINTDIYAGSHIVNWDAGNIGSGVYILRMQAGNYSSSQKLILVK